MSFFFFLMVEVSCSFSLLKVYGLERRNKINIKEHVQRNGRNENSLRQFTTSLTTNHNTFFKYKWFSTFWIYKTQGSPPFFSWQSVLHLRNKNPADVEEKIAQWSNNTVVYRTLKPASDFIPDFPSLLPPDNFIRRFKHYEIYFEP